MNRFTRFAANQRLTGSIYYAARPFCLLLREGKAPMSTTPEAPLTPEPTIAPPVAAVSSGPTLPDYLQAAQPNPVTNRRPWYLNTAPTYAGIFLWFVFWDSMPANGLNKGGLWVFLAGTVIAGLICHFLFYLVPGLLGKRTGLPLYVVGASTFGSIGGLIMPGFLMGLLQFGWLAVNIYASCRLLADSTTSPLFYGLCVVWGVAAAFIGLKGIQYVAKVATFIPLIPLAVLIYALVRFAPSAGDYQPIPTGASQGATIFDALCLVIGAIVGFFATAGAAGVDFGANNRNARDVQLGGLVGIFLATVFTAGAAGIAVAGAWVVHALPNDQITKQVRDEADKQGMNAAEKSRRVHEASFTLTNGLKTGLDETAFRLLLLGLALAALPGACFSSFIAANSFKTVMPRVNPFISVGIGAAVSIALAVTHLAADLVSVFLIIGASFGPICGAMFVDYFEAGGRWSGPRAGFNPAGWVAWLLGFIVGILPFLGIAVPAAPVAAFCVGAIVYFLMARLGIETPVVPYAPAQVQNEA
jgi:cytosine permease